MGCRIRRIPSFRTLAGKCGSERQAGLPFLSLTGLLPVASVPYGIVFSFTDDSAGNVWVSHQEGLFHLFRGACGRTHPLGQARAQTTG